MAHSERGEEHAAHSCAMENTVARIRDGIERERECPPVIPFHREGPLR